MMLGIWPTRTKFGYDVIDDVGLPAISSVNQFYKQKCLNMTTQVFYQMQVVQRIIESVSTRKWWQVSKRKWREEEVGYIHILVLLTTSQSANMQKMWQSTVIGIVMLFLFDRQWMFNRIAIYIHSNILYFHHRLSVFERSLNTHTNRDWFRSIYLTFRLLFEVN